MCYLLSCKYSLNMHFMTIADFGTRQLENLAIVKPSWQRPPFLIDTYGEGILYLQVLNKTFNKKKLVIIDMDTRQVTYSFLHTKSEQSL